MTKRSLSTVKALRIFTTIAIFISVIGCTSRKEEAPSLALLNSMAPNTAGFIYWNTQAESFKRYISSPWGQAVDGLEWIDQPELKKIQSALTRSGVIHYSSGHIDSISEGVAFFVPPADSSKNLDFALYLNGTGDKDMTSVVGLLKTELVNEGLVVTDVNSPEGSATLRVAIPNSVPQYPNEVLISASKGKLSVASNQELLKAGLSTTNASSPAILTKPKYLELKNGITERGSFVIAAMDISSILPILEESTKAVDPNADLKSLPISFLTYDRTFSSGPKDRISLALESKSESQNQAIKSLTGSKDISSSIPDDAVISLDLDGAAFAKLGEIEQLQGMANVKSLLNQISRLSMFVRTGGTGSIFPEVILSIKSQNSDKFKKELVSQIKELSQLSAGALSPWKSVSIAGTNVEYALSPLGIGIYMGNIGEQTVIASSDAYFKSVLESGNKSTLSSLVDKIKKTHDNNLLLGYFDFKKVASLGRDLQGTVGIFSGGTPPPGADDPMKSLEQLGNLLFEVKIEASSVLIEAAYTQ